MIRLNPHSNIRFSLHGGPVWSPTGGSRRKPSQIRFFDEMFVGCSDSKEDAHHDSFELLHGSATLKNSVDLWHVRLIIYDNTIDFAPGVGLERKHLYTNDHFSLPPVPA
jgi:hypothetical protein